MKQYQVTAKQVAKYPGYEIGGRFFTIGIPEIIGEAERSHAAFDDVRMFDVMEIESAVDLFKANLEALRGIATPLGIDCEGLTKAELREAIIAAQSEAESCQE
jgi:hypothetical protein